MFQHLGKQHPETQGAKRLSQGLLRFLGFPRIIETSGHPIRSNQ
jgi:hypothetical protein